MRIIYWSSDVCSSDLTPFMLLVSKPIWDTYSAEEQTILRDCAIVGRDVQRKVSRELSDQSLAKLKESGMQVNELAPEEQTRMREKAQAVYARHAGSIGEETIEKVQAALEQVRTAN